MISAREESLGACNMLPLISDFIGAGTPNCTSRDTPLHVYNDLGHRCKSITQIDTSNYILFTGCSHTQGVGLELEDSYPYVTSKLLNSDYYNLGIGGSGCDVMMYNLMTWLHKFDHKPKLLVVQWPFELRYVRQITENNKNIQTEGSWSKDIYLDFMLNGDRVGYFSLRTKLYIKLLENINIPKIYVSFPEYNRHLQDYIEFQDIDKAQDNQHLGPKSHRLLSEKIVDKYLNVVTYSNTRGQSD